MGLEPIWSPTRPSNVRVYLFRHDRILCVNASYIIKYVKSNVNCFLGRK